MRNVVVSREALFRQIVQGHIGVLDDIMEYGSGLLAIVRERLHEVERVENVRGSAPLFLIPMGLDGDFYGTLQITHASSVTVCPAWAPHICRPAIFWSLTRPGALTIAMRLPYNDFIERLD